MAGNRRGKAAEKQAALIMQRFVMRAREMSTAERIVRKIRREPFIDEKNELFRREM